MAAVDGALSAIRAIREEIDVLVNQQRAFHYS
jgi:hypothetical protein